ncbi:MAG: restriction endonuclease subunit S [Chloroflexota bacterium]
MNIRAVDDPADAEDSLPEGWVSAIVGDLVGLGSGKGLPKEKFSREQVPGGVIVGGAGGPIGWTQEANASSPVLTLGRVGAVGAINVYASDAWVTDNALIVTSSEPEIVRFLGHWFSQIAWTDLHTGSSQPLITQGLVKSLAINMPPLSEQRRIADAVERLLARVEAGRARLERMPAILKRFRQAVLAAACSGRLTEDWRGQHPTVESADSMLARCVSESSSESEAGRRRRRRRGSGAQVVDPPDEIPAAWTVRTLSDLITDRAVIEIQDGNHGELYPRSSEFGSEGAVFLTAKQVTDGRVLIDEAPKLSMEKAGRLRIGFARSNDVLLTHNATVGRAAVLRDAPDPCLLGTSVTYHRLNLRFMDPDYYCQFLRSPFWQDQLAMVMEQTTRNQVPITKQVDLSVIVPPVDEQREIATRVKGLFGLADAVERRVAAARKQADALPQAILARAFSGKLVPTEAELARREGRAYEPASALLERIRRERAELPRVRRGRGGGRGSGAR